MPPPRAKKKFAHAARSPRQVSNEVHGRDCTLMEGKAEPVVEAAPQPLLTLALRLGLCDL
jgi:hypothetical protein